MLSYLLPSESPERMTLAPNNNLPVTPMSLSYPNAISSPPPAAAALSPPGSPSALTSDSDEMGTANSSEPTKKKRRTGFIETLFLMANTPENETAIGFNPDGVSLEIRNTADFSTRVLPKHFKHKNVSSFIRQLNNYGFRTIPSPKGIFQTFVHDNFIKDRRDLIKFISRRSGGEIKKKKTLYEQVVEFKQRELDRNQRLEELETRDMQRTMYINDLENQNRVILEEREALIMENQRLLMILSANTSSSSAAVAALGRQQDARINGPQQIPPPPPAHLAAAQAHAQQQQQQQQLAAAMNHPWAPLFDPISAGAGQGMQPGTVVGRSDHQDAMDWLSRLS